MEIKYVGPRALISSGGISFDSEKKDKFIYLYSFMQLIEATDHDYVEEKIYTYKAEAEPLKSDAIINALRPYCHDIETSMAKAQQSGESYVKEALVRARESVVLNDVEKRVLTNNIDLMHDYIVQRHLNKSVYYCVAQMFIDRLKHNRIDYISAPMNLSYFHIFNTLQRSLRQQKSPVNSKLSFHVESSELFVELKMTNI